MWCMLPVEYYSTIKKEEILSYATMMNLEGLTLNETSQSQKGKCCMIPLIGGI